APPGGARGATFSIPSGVAVRGGYSGLAGPDPDQRDIVAFVTTLSGDLNGDSTASFANENDNSFHLVTILSGSSSTVLDGVTVRAGYNAGPGSSGTGPGAGVAVTGGSPVVIDCILTANDGGSGGGGMSIVNSFGQVTRCTFTGNRAQTEG